MNSQQAHEKTLHTVSHEGNANEKHSETPLRVCSCGLNQKDGCTRADEDAEALGPCALLVGAENGTAALENHLAGLIKDKHKFIMTQRFHS